MVTRQIKASMRRTLRGEESLFRELSHQWSLAPPPIHSLDVELAVQNKRRQIIRGCLNWAMIRWLFCLDVKVIDRKAIERWSFVDLIENCGDFPPSTAAPCFTDCNRRRINQTRKNGRQWQGMVHRCTIGGLFLIFFLKAQNCSENPLFGELFSLRLNGIAHFPQKSSQNEPTVWNSWSQGVWSHLY